jgi:8-oxo-dGTP pyrophosphatase MutT (NUDIX family)
MSNANPPLLSAGVVIVRGGPGAYRYLLLRAYRYWDFPKGVVAAGESPLAAACREAREETGLSDLNFRWGDRYVETALYGTGKIARYYLALSSTGEVILGINPVLGRPEHHGYRWVDYDAGLDLLVPRVRAVLDWARTLLEKSA